jgi:carboxyl-terminal processing protease
MKVIGNIIGLIVLFSVGFAWRDIQNGNRDAAVRAFGQLVGISSVPQEAPEQEFMHAYSRIQADYYRPVKPLALKYAGMGGMMASLGDPHTMFLVPQVAKSFNLSTKANYVGIGARLSTYVLNGHPIGARIAVVFEDGPGYAAGLRRGDVVISANGTSLAGLTIEDTVDKIMGAEGTMVKLGVLKGGLGDPVYVSVRRSRVTTPTVESEYFPDSHVGYIYIATFSAPTVEQFDKELEKLERNSMKGLVIDVRGNPGGYLETAVDLLSRFKANKVVVAMKMRDGALNHEYTSSGLEHNFKYPVVVLINEDSASAAEIFSGALRDYGMTTLVGTHSYGKASVQEVYDFKDGSSGKITIARYFLPATGNIGRVVDEDGSYISGGLEPDVKVEEEDVLPEELRRHAANWNSDLPNPATDSQLRKAIEVVLSKSK